MAHPTEHDEHPVVMDRTKARQGRRGLPVLYVLIGGIGLAVIAWIIVEYAIP